MKVLGDRNPCLGGMKWSNGLWCQTFLDAKGPVSSCNSKMFINLLDTGCSLNIVFFRRFFKDIFRTLASLSFPSVSVSVHNGRSNTSAAAAELAEFRKIATF